ncbi:MAG: LytR/AlgR family response regulator transcription factor [Lachnospiraceae bacterium]
MLTIAICDDEKQFLHRIRDYVTESLNKKHVVFEIDTFNSGQAFINTGFELAKYDIVFMDINMDQMNGLEAAQRIREISKDVYIVFVTAFIDYSLEGYKVNAIRYLLKNNVNMGKAIHECLGAILENMDYNIETEEFEFKEGTRTVSLDRIVYIESKLHKLKFFVLEDQIEVYTLYEILNKMEEKLNKDTFLRIHQSYLVNMKYISSINRTEVILRDHSRLPMPRARYQEAKDRFIAYKGEFYV